METKKVFLAHSHNSCFKQDVPKVIISLKGKLKKENPVETDIQ